MKNEANAPRTPATMISMKRIPRFIAAAIGVLTSPKHTGQASAARGAARSPIIVRSVLRMVARLKPLQSFRLPLERRAVERQPDAARQRTDGRHRITDRVVRLILLPCPRRDERREHHR